MTSITGLDQAKVQPASDAEFMRAAYIVKYGKDQLRVDGHYPRPQASRLYDGYVLIRVHCVSLQPSDSKTRKGALKVLTGIAGQSGPPDGTMKNAYVLGYDCAGTIMAVGPNVTGGWKAGDEVCCVAMAGALAELTVVHQSMLAPMPAGLSFAHAAAFITAGLTASQALRHATGVAGPLRRVLITGGSGGVGTVAIQYAKSVLGVALVAATASSAKAEFVRSLGADIVVDYKQQDWPKAAKDALRGKLTSSTDTSEPLAFDMVLDCTAEAKIILKAGLVRPGGELVCITTDRPDSLPSGAMVNQMLLAHRQQPLPCCVPVLLNALTSSTRTTAGAGGAGATSVGGKGGTSGNKGKSSKVVHRHNMLMLPTGLQEVIGHAADGRIRLTIDRVYPLTQASDAMDYVEDGHVTGRVIVECFPGAAAGVTQLHPL